MEFKTIILKKDENVATIIMNRPDRMNALIPEMFGELKEALEEVNTDDDVRVVILTGAGKGFCTGSDIKEGSAAKGQGLRAEKGIDEVRQHIRHNPQKITLAIRNLEKPIIAAVNGPAVADGFDWALACDLRVGSENARFMNAFVRMALFPNTGATWLLPRIVGLGKALEILYTGDWLNAEEAHRIGVLNKLVPATDLESETMSLARKLAKQPPVSLRLMKMQTYRGLDISLEAALELAADGEAMTLKTEDHKEALAAFTEKREPKFKGK
ncbi:MAG: enoyl-CoA hydratase [Chloroflexi bacterium]|nr:enoyl-CoA hydratase [Chloroflexota bacterium]